MVWLTDGSVLGATRVGFEGGLFELHRDVPPATEADASAGERVASVRPEFVAAVAFDTRRLIPVSSLVGDGSVRGRGSPFNAEPIVLRGASSVRVPLPADARRLSLRAELPLRARAWGRCELVLSTDGVVRARLPVSGGSPVVEHELDLDGATSLGLRLEPGAYGRVHAEVEVREALISVE